jgi:hypothetical protein
METLLSVIALWLSVNFGLSATEPHPRIEFHRAATMTQFWAENIATHKGAGHRLSEPEANLFEIGAFYDDRRQIIFLPDDWNPNNPTDLSVLVHEMVHHLQNLRDRTFACRAERERLAYQAQDAWLGLFQSSLESGFGIDPLTVLVRTQCMY